MLRSTVVAALFLACCSTGSASAATDRFVPCTDTADFPELTGSQCLTTSVPLRHELPDGKSIELSVRRFPVAEAGKRRGEVWLVAGGPGEPGASLYPFLATFRKAFPHHDLVLPDHRGTGESERLCPQQESLGSASGVALAGEEWGPCIGSLYADQGRASAFSITQAAQDLSTLLTRYRGEGEVLLYSVSYGTQLALRMLQVSPTPLDGLILDGLVPPENAARWDLSHRTAVVDAVGRDLLGEADAAALQRLLDSSDPDAAWRKQVPGGDLRRFFGTLLNFPTLRTRIPSIVEGLSKGDDTALRATIADLKSTVAELTRYPFSPPSLPLVMLISTSENSGRRDLSRETVEAEASTALFTSAIPGFLVDSPVPRYERDQWFGSTPAALPRTLVIHGTLDPNTPYASARAHADRLAKAGSLTFSTVQRGAHLLAYVAPKCFVEITSAFVEKAPVLESCVEHGQES